MGNLIKINFSKGIRDSELNENFSLITDQIEDERLSLAGDGLSSGLEMTLTNNILTINKGDIVNKVGEKLSFDAKTFTIAYPELEEFTQTVFVPGTYAKLDYIPYNINKKQTVEVSYIDKNIITAKTLSNTDIEISKVEGTSVFFKTVYTGNLDIIYRHTDIRYDTIYIDTDNTIKIAKGITSSVANKYIPENAYVLGYILIDPYGSVDKNHVLFSLIPTKISFRKVRTLEEDLYLNGNKFDDMGIIHLEKPSLDVLQDRMIWLDKKNNLLKQYRKNLDEWFTINDNAFANKTESWLWGTTVEDNIDEQIPTDGKIFLFNTDEKRKLRFIPNTNSVTVIVDNIVLHKDQYQEILDPDQTENQFLVNRGYGISFEKSLLDGKDHVVEIIIKHNINANEVTNRWLRSATIVEKHDMQFTTDENPNQLFRLLDKHYYLFNKGQLQIVVQGEILRKSEFEEGPEITDPQSGDKCKSFRILKALSIGDWVSYRIDKAIFTYDGFDEFLGEYSENIKLLDTKLNTFIDSWTPTYEAIQAEQESLREDIVNINETLVSIQSSINTLSSSKRDKTVDIEVSDLDTDVSSRIQNGFINLSTTMPDGGIISLDVEPSDYVNIFYNKDKTLIKSVDFTITSGTITITSEEVNIGDQIFITGLKYR